MRRSLRPLQKIISGSMRSNAQSPNSSSDIFNAGTNATTSSSFSLASLISGTLMDDPSSLFRAPTVAEPNPALSNETHSTAPRRKFDFSGIFADFKQIHQYYSFKMDPEQSAAAREAWFTDRPEVRELVLNRARQATRHLRRKQYGIKTHAPKTE